MSNEHFDAVIVGSGFGGSVMAYRLAEAGLRVCLLDPWSFKGSGALVSAGLGGGSLIYANILIRKDPRWFVKESHDGGAYESWPITYDDLEGHYEQVERMMNAQQYPLKTLAMKEANEKLDSMPSFDRSWTHKWELLNLAVSFRRRNLARPDDDPVDNPPVVGAEVHEDRPNYHTVTMGREMPRSTCRLCGECDLGYNYGSKNTLDYTYVSAAIHQ